MPLTPMSLQLCKPFLLCQLMGFQFRGSRVSREFANQSDLELLSLINRATRAGTAQGRI